MVARLEMVLWMREWRERVDCSREWRRADKLSWAGACGWVWYWVYVSSIYSSIDDDDY